MLSFLQALDGMCYIWSMVHQILSIPLSPLEQCHCFPDPTCSYFQPWAIARYSYGKKKKQLKTLKKTQIKKFFKAPSMQNLFLFLLALTDWPSRSCYIHSQVYSRSIFYSYEILWESHPVLLRSLPILLALVFSCWNMKIPFTTSREATFCRQEIFFPWYSIYLTWVMWEKPLLQEIQSMQ